MGAGLAGHGLSLPACIGDPLYAEFGRGPPSLDQPASGEGALEAIAAYPGGRALLGLLAVGFLGYAVLALMEAALRHQETKGATERWARRLFLAGVAVLYLAFSVYAASLVVRPRLGPARAGGAHHPEIELTARVLGWPFGQVLVGAGMGSAIRR